MEKISQYCQKCRAANEPGDLNCWRCGTRLMLVVIPPSVRHEEAIAPSYYEDHLLERVSLLELRLSQIAERLSMALDLMLRQAKTTQTDHYLLETIIESLGELGIAEKTELAGKLRNKIKAQNSREAAETRQERIFKDILLQHTNPNADLLANLIREGVNFLDQSEEKQGFRLLERAVQLSPKNTALLIFLAENLFRADKFDLARHYLEKAFETAPQEPKILLLLGVIYADQGEAERGRKFLSLLSDRREMLFCVNYVWGFLAAAEGLWTEALAAFREILNVRDYPETEFLVGCAYFQLKQFKLAQKHFKAALEKDGKFADAWFMLGIVCEILDEKIKADEAFQSALSTKESGAQCLEFLKRNSSPGELPTVALPFMRLGRPGCRLITGNSRRLSRIFRKELDKLF